MDERDETAKSRPAEKRPDPVPAAKPRFFAPTSAMAKALRKAVKQLPVLRNGEVQRVAALAGVASPTCARCASFDLAAGQHALVQNGDFALAARVLRPSQMQKVETNRPLSEDTGFDRRGQPIDDGGPDWKEMGACRRLGRFVFAPHTCKDWS